jgi:hypothetical protein
MADNYEQYFTHDDYIEYKEFIKKNKTNHHKKPQANKHIRV